MLQLALAPLEPGPVQQPVRVERVVGAPPLALAEGEADRLAALADRLGVAFDLLGRDAVLARQVLDDLLALRRHLRVQLERLEVQVGLHFAVEPLERAFERVEADRAPGAGDIGDEIDLHRSSLSSA